MKLKTLCKPRASVFAADRRATVLNLDTFLKGQVNGSEFFDENYFTNGMLTLVDPALRHRVLADKDPAPKLGRCRVVGFNGRNSDAPGGLWGSIAEQLEKSDLFTHQNPAVWADLGMILWAAGLKATAAWTISTETEAAGIKKGNYVRGTVCLVPRKRIADEPGFLDEVYPLVEDEVKRQIASMQALDEDSEPNFNDADYQLAAYAAALKVLTQYSNIDGRDVEHEVFAVRSRNEKSDFQILIERALEIACDYLVPRGLDHSWRDLSSAERYYLRALDIESRGERRKGMYEELARGFGVTDIRPLLKSDKANGARMHTASGFASTILAQADRAIPASNALPTRRGRNSTQAVHPFAAAPLRHLLFAIRETAAADNNPELGRQYLRDTFGQAYWSHREKFIGLLEWLAQLGNAAGMEEWHEDSEAARILVGRLRNDQA
ncbi:MAG: hypothetical protein ACKO3T_13240 [Planctomycetaceae bacterium]